MLSRRHMLITQARKKYPQGLVFYAPLNQGNLRDMISGTEPTTSINSTVNWNSEKNMYDLTATKRISNNYYGAALMYKGEALEAVIGNVHNTTLMITCEINPSGNPSNYEYGPLIAFPSLSEYRYYADNQDGPDRRDMIINYMCKQRYQNDSNLVTGIHVYASVLNTETHNMKFYCDGELILEYPNTWAQNQTETAFKETVAICESHINSNLAITAKEAKIFNRCLTQEEIIAEMNKSYI